MVVRVSLILLFLISVFLVPLVAEDKPSGADKILQLVKSGTDESSLLAFVYTYPGVFQLTDDDTKKLRNAGVPDEVIVGVLNHDAGLLQNVEGTKQSSFSTFQLYDQQLFFGDQVFNLENGLEPAPAKILESDPAVAGYVRSFQFLDTESHILTWSGLGLLITGCLYGILTAPLAKTDYTVNGAIAAGAAGTGLVAVFSSIFVDQTAYKNLIEGLAVYNHDQIVK